MKKEELKHILENHLLWLNNKGGEKADLEGANLEGTYLAGAKNMFTFNKINGRTCYAVVFKNTLMIKAGCFWGSLKEFEGKCKYEYPNNGVEAYEAQINYLKSLEKNGS